jgi:hypothetical protein
MEKIDLNIFKKKSYHFYKEWVGVARCVDLRGTIFSGWYA